MVKRVILTLIDGSFEQGFPVILRIRGDDATETEIQGKLPPAPGILELFQDWQLAYRQLVMPHSRIRPKPAQVTNFSCRQLGDDLAVSFNGWLNSGSKEWQKIRDGLQRNLGETEEIQVIIQTEDIRLRRLPWHSWDLFFNHYTKAEIALSAPEYKSRGRSPLSNKVRILAILGDSTGIDVQKDRAMLEQLPNAEPPTFLVEPQRQELNDQLWEQQWQILFFAGHSCSEAEGNTGKIYINPTDSLSIGDLKNALRRAIAGGLQLVIFNSCDGLGLARELADLHIPQIILMREPVPDLVAQEFLKQFLISFAKGNSLYVAVRDAREKLQGLENQFPFASWLPIICQNPAEVPLTWHSLRRGNVSDRQNVTLRSYYKVFLLLFIPLTSTWGLNTVRNMVIDQPLCFGVSCIGRDAVDNKCDIDKRTITSTIGNFPVSEGKITAFKIEMRHSHRCNSTWVRTTGSFITGSIDYLEDREENRYGQAKIQDGLTQHYSDMGPGDIEIKACVQPPRGEVQCTNFVKP